MNECIDWYEMARRVYHRNDMRPALIGMGLGAKRIFLGTLIQIPRQSTKDNVVIEFDCNQVFTISVQWYADVCGIDYAAAYRQMVEGVKELRGYVIEPDSGLLKKPDQNNPKDWIEPFTIAERGSGYSKGEGFIRIKLAPEMAPLISELKESFTSLFFMSAMQLPDGNAGKLYIVLREWISSGYTCDRIVKVDELKESLGVSRFPSYEIFTEFKRRFFDGSVSKIVEKTEFNEIKMEIVERRARKAYKVKITYDYDMKSIEKKDKIAEKIMTSPQPVLSKEHKQINGRFYDQKSAEAAGINWNDH